MNRFMFGNGKYNSRRKEIRRNRLDSEPGVLARLREQNVSGAIIVGVFFWLAASAVLILRENVVPFRPGQWTRHSIVSRVDFSYRDEKQLAAARQTARQTTPRVYKFVEPECWTLAEQDLLALPERVKGLTLAELPTDLRPVLDAGALSKLQEYATPVAREKFEKPVKDFIASAREARMVILPEQQRQQEQGREIQLGAGVQTIGSGQTLTPADRDDISTRLMRLAEPQFSLVMQPKIVALTMRRVGPTHVLDDVATAEARNQAADRVPTSAGDVIKKANMPIVDVGVGGGEIKQDDWLLLKAENQAYLATLGPARWGQWAGLAGIVALMTVVVGGYIARYQPRVAKNVARAAAIAALLLMMLLTSELAALGSSSIYFFGIAPTILVAMILTIAYDQRFAIGLGAFQAVLVTLALDADISFLAILASGIVTACFLLDNLRSRSKLIEVGGGTALAMIAAACATGLVQFDPLQYIARSGLYAGAAGFTVGFVVLGILPFIEKAFRITTSMTLLELADASQPLLRRLALEAPGTYAHSQQVATLSQEAAEAIGADGLLCRVAAYYHDVGKINKADYFVENQVDGHNRHLNLTPSVSLLIIIGHVKDGLELAREYNLPTNLTPFIQQHHGTTLVEHFYKQACDTCTPDQKSSISETQYRYPGPRPRTREVAILMLADAVESACRSMSEPTASRIEGLVHDIALRRLHDGQLAECDLTLRDLDRIERSFNKTLLGIYHGRIAYPSTSSITSSGNVPPGAATRTA